MAFEIWPSSLPSNFLIAGYGFAMGDGRLRTKMDTGPKKVRLRSSFVPSPLSGTILLSGDQIQTLTSFVKVTLLGGTLPFVIADPVLSTISGHRAVVRFVELPNWTAITPDLYSVTLRLEQLDTISPPTPVFSTTPMPDAREDRPYSWTPTVIEGTRPLRGFSIVAGSLPQGLSFDSSTGRITGTVPFFGTFSFTLRVEDAEGRTATIARSLVVRPPAFIYAGEGSSRIILDPVTVRASEATYWGKDGLLKVAPPHAPRFEYDPLTGVFRGVLIEEARTNTVTWSQAFEDAVWVKVGIGTLEPNALLAPDGSMTGTRLVESTSNGQRRLHRIVALNSNECVSSFFVHRGSSRRRVSLYPGTGGSGRISRFNLDNLDAFDGSNVGTGTGTEGVEIINDNWVRLWTYVHLSEVSPTIQCWFYYSEGPNGNSVHQGDGSSWLGVWGAQSEAGTFPTSYIPTTTAAVTRTADRLSIPNGWSQEWFNPVDSTIVVDFLRQVPSGNYRLIDRLSGSNGVIVQTNGDATGRVNFQVTGAGGVVTNTSKDFVGFNEYARVACAYSPDDVAISVDGLTTQSAQRNANTPAGTASNINIGWSNVLTTDTMTGYLKEISFIPRRLSNAELQARSAL